ncbi:hypothetical protein L873DRAFT_1848800 [Choiromyces venosus 120613-1]|uniref:Uncharacterized protein n=1 Tax=Choiromyces venosus 120613-1 TaxID=1336337 RepID=A0A3N4IWW0_9PEZI|nr:hypothetical protein L873DRAFT_1848800 [Choiromyces venosus 120613-1]
MADNQPQPALRPLPNLKIIVQCLRTIVTEVEKFENLPAFDQGARILAALQELQQGMAGLQQGQADHEQRLVELQHNVVELQQRQLDLPQGQAGILEHIQRLEDDSSRRDKNNIARAINSTGNLRANLLEPLYGLNGLLVPNFPRTGADIERLGGDGINALLAALGLEMGGTVVARKERFKKYIGFVAGMD